MSRSDFLKGYMHAMRKVAGVSGAELVRDIEEAAKTVPEKNKRELKALEAAVDGLKKPKLAPIGGNWIGPAALAGIIGIPVVTGAGLYYLHKSGNK